MKLREEIKKIMYVGFLISIMILILIINENDTNKAINQCVNAGNSYNFCEDGLR